MKTTGRTSMFLSATLCVTQLTTLLLLTGCDDAPGEVQTDTTSTANKTTSGPPAELSAGKMGGQTIASAAANVAPLVAGTGLPGITDERTFNMLFTSVTICATLDPGNCQTIDHVVVDTASSGLRIMSSVLSPWLLQNLVKETRAYDADPIAECWLADDGYSWGSIRLADVQMSGEMAESIPIQVIGDPLLAAKVPQNCSGSGVSKNTVQALGVNGILGVGVLEQDCGTVCAQSTTPSAKGAWYYTCPAQGGCIPSAVGLSEQMVNPVAEFRTDNNGVIVELPPVGVWGAPLVDGSLVFGIGTQSNNTLGNADVYTLDDDGYAAIQYEGMDYHRSVVDSRSPAYTFNNASIHQCEVGEGFYCPASPLNLSLLILGRNGASSAVTFTVTNEITSLDARESYSAFSEFGQTSRDPDAFGLGLPFFYGRNVFFGISGRGAYGDGHPYVAF